MLAHRRHQLSAQEFLAPLAQDKGIVSFKFCEPLGNGLGMPCSSRSVHHDSGSVGIDFGSIADF